MDQKYIFSIVAIICFTGLQIAAWILGIDGQVFAFTTTAISSIIAFLIGLNITPPAAKQVINTVMHNLKTTH